MCILKKTTKERRKDKIPSPLSAIFRAFADTKKALFLFSPELLLLGFVQEGAFFVL